MTRLWLLSIFRSKLWKSNQGRSNFGLQNFLARPIMKKGVLARPYKGVAYKYGPEIWVARPVLSFLFCFCLASPIRAVQLCKKMFSGPSLYTPAPVYGDYKVVFNRSFLLDRISCIKTYQMTCYLRPYPVLHHRFLLPLLLLRLLQMLPDFRDNFPFFWQFRNFHLR